MQMCACAILPFLIKGVEQGSRPGRTSGRGPVQPRQRAGRRDADAAAAARCGKRLKRRDGVWAVDFAQRLDDHKLQARSEEHTSELQSRENLVCRLLLEKKKKTTAN